jgi:hypothetical protein
MPPAQFAAAQHNRRLPLQPENDPRPIATRYFANITIDASAIESWLTGGQPAESKLASAQNEAAEGRDKPVKNKPGGGGHKMAAAIQAMVTDVQDGKLELDDLCRMKQKELLGRFPNMGERTTLAQARREALKKLAASTKAPTKLRQSSDK